MKPIETTKLLLSQVENLRAAAAGIDAALASLDGALRLHIQAFPEACHVCHGSGEVEMERLAPCCSGFEDGRQVCGCGGGPIWEPYAERCPYKC